VRCQSLFKTVVLVACLAGLVACKSKTEPSGTSGPGKKQGQVLAEANGVTLTTDDLNTELESLPPYLKPMAQTPEGRKELLDTMIIRELILQQAAKEGVDKSKEVADKLAELKKRVVIEAFLRKQVEEKINIPDTELQKFYDENREKFRTGDQVRASHILVKTEKEAQDILAKLKGGAKFEDLASQYSADSSAAKGGDLGWFGKGVMLPEFEKAVFGLKDGQTSGVVKTKFGHHIIKLTGTRKAGIMPFDEVKEQIKAALLPTKQQELFQKIKEDIKKGAKISIKEDALKETGQKSAEPAEKPAK
jgi:peptidyl-prolyl cis-trans isomerase C